MTDVGFQTYEDRFPFESDYLEGGQPFFQIERLSPTEPSLVAVSCDSAGFEMFAEEGKNYEVRSVGIQLVGANAEIALSRTTSTNYLKRLYLYSSVPDVEISGSLTLPDLSKFDRLYEIHLSQMLGLFDLRPLTPSIRSATFDTMSMNADETSKFWKNLEYLRIDGFEGALEKMGSLDALSTLKLYSAKLKSIDMLGVQLPNLQSLTLQGQRAPLSVVSLSGCQNLEYLRFDAFSKAEGLSNVIIPALKGAYLTHLGSSNFIDNHKNLSWLRVKKFSGEVSETMFNKGWAKSYGEFGFGNAEVPKLLRG